MTTEETNPVEREANPDEQRRRDEEWDRQVASLADYNAGWDAALERAATVAHEELEQKAAASQDLDESDEFLREAQQVATAILALKGSR